jgi:hypothetical protein
MRLRRPSARWLYRDLRLSYVLLVWVAFGFSLFIYVKDSAPAPHGAAILPRGSATMPPTDDDMLSTASIILVPARGERCWQRILDNRTGRMWDNGYVNCYDAVSQAHGQKRTAASSVRLTAISNAFRHDGN